MQLVIYCFLSIAHRLLNVIHLLYFSLYIFKLCFMSLCLYCYMLNFKEFIFEFIKLALCLTCGRLELNFINFLTSDVS